MRWSPAEAARFLHSVPELEGAGVAVRVPVNWRAGRPPRPQVGALRSCRAAPEAGRARGGETTEERAPVAPVTVEGRTIARTFWGGAWCDNLESYGDYETRLPRGRTYVRSGAVLDLQISPLEIKAMVSGSSIYEVTVTIKGMAPILWESICMECAGGIDSLIELLQGVLKGVMEKICRQDGGLFPRPSEIRFSCTCPDGAQMCKHVAAVLYAVGARLSVCTKLPLAEGPPCATRSASMKPGAGKISTWTNRPVVRTSLRSIRTRRPNSACHG